MPDNYADMIRRILPETERPFSQVVVLVVNQRTDAIAFSAADALGALPHPKDVRWALYLGEKYVDQALELEEAPQEEDGRDL